MKTQKHKKYFALKLFIIGILLVTSVFALNDPRHLANQIEVTDNLCSSILGSGRNCGDINDNVYDLDSMKSFLPNGFKDLSDNDIDKVRSASELDTIARSLGYFKNTNSEINFDNPPGYDEYLNKVPGKRGEPTIDFIKALTNTIDSDIASLISCKPNEIIRKSPKYNSWEQCDDGNNVNGDGCSANCKKETKGYCGDYTYTNSDWEECDDGNNVNGDGCSADCQIETNGYCGDGTKNNDWEQCDDGNNNNGDGCSAHCKWEHKGNTCGNGEIHPERQCVEPYKYCYWTTQDYNLCPQGTLLAGYNWAKIFTKPIGQWTLDSGWKNQIYCCGDTYRSCTPTDWNTYHEWWEGNNCPASNDYLNCPYPGFWITQEKKCYQQKTNADCLTNTQIIDCGTRNIYCNCESPK